MEIVAESKLRIINYLNVILLPQVKVYYSPYTQPPVIKLLPVSINNQSWNHYDNKYIFNNLYNLYESIIYYKEALKTRTKQQRTRSIKTKELLAKKPNENNEN